MTEIQRVLSKAAWRLGLINFAAGLVLALAIALGLIIVGRVVAQAFSLQWPWMTIAISAGGAVVLSSLIWAIVKRPSQAAVARRVDEGADLREALSTALSVAPNQNTDPWAKVTVDSASRIARGVNVRQAVPLRGPKFWPVVMGLGLTLAIVWVLMPQMDVLGWRKQAIAEKDKQAQIQQVQQDIADSKKIEELAKQLGIEKEPIEPPTGAQAQAMDPDALRRSAIQDLTKLEDRLEQLQSGTKGQTLQSIQNKLKQLSPPGEKTSELARAMAKGDMGKAKEELSKLQKELANSELQGKERQELAEQMKDLSKQLEQLAENKSALDSALQQAGIDPKAAANPESLKNAIEQAQNLSQEQKSALQEMAQAMSQSESAMDSLAKAAEQMAQAAQNGDQQGQQQAGEQMSQQLSQLEQMAQEMQMAQSAQQQAQQQLAKLGQCDGGQGEGGDCQGSGNSAPGVGNKWKDGWNQANNQGRGGRRNGTGSGQGSMSTAERAEFGTQGSKNIGELRAGPSVSTRLVEGESIRGESSAQLSQAISDANQRSSEAIDNVSVPREFQDAIKHYFSTGGTPAQSKDAKKPGAAAPAQPATPAKPAEPAADAGKK